MKKVFNYLWILSVMPIILVAIVKVSFILEDYDLMFTYHKELVVEQNISEIIRSWPGFKAEEYYVTTDDGYKLLVERSYSKITQKNPIIIVHGIAMNALGWVARGNVSLARLLGDLGYDVWMLNYRGTWYSKRHVNLTTSDKRYWKYNINDLGIYDVRSTVRLVAKQTNRQAIYIGYSMGTTGFYIYSSTYPEETKQLVKGMIGLAPVINYKDIKSIATLSSPVWPALKWFIYNFWNGEILPGYSIFLRPLLRFSGGMYMIQSVANLIFGDDYDQMDPLTYPHFATQILDTAAVEVYSHFLQFYESDIFRKYDYGKNKNLEVYGTLTPPVYDLSKVPVPVALFVGENDWLATLTNAKQIYSELQPSVRCGFRIVPFKKWNHIDFLIAKDLPKYLYKDLFQKIYELGKGVCR